MPDNVEAAQPTKPCEICKTAFTRYSRESHSRFSIRRFCSRGCQYTARRKNPVDTFVGAKPVEVAGMPREVSQENPV